MFDLYFFFLEHAGELRIFVLKEKEKSNYTRTLYGDKYNANMCVAAKK